jgi:phage tail sheath protein FI
MSTYNLPGVYTIYKERKPVVAATNTASTDSLLIFGTATDGPKFVPYNVTRPQDGAQTFGSYSVPQIGSSMLMPAINEAYYAGARNIIGVRITGLDATLALQDDTTKVMDLFGKYPGAKYNKVQVEITADEIRIWNVADSALNKVAPTVAYAKADYTSINLLVNQINKDSAISDVRATVVLGKENTVSTTLATVAKTVLAGGDDQLTEELGDYTLGTGLRGALAKAYDIFVEFETKLVVPLGVSVGFTDDATPVFDKQDAQKLAEFCYEAAKRNNDIIGVIPVAPLNDTSLAGVKALADKLATVDNTYKDTEEGIDIGKYINIVVGEPLFSDTTIGGYANTASACYFGLASKLPVQSGTTNKTISGANSLRYTFSPTQIENLRANKFTVLKYKLGRGVVVVEGLLGSLPISDFQALSTLRIIHSITDAIRDAVDPFIGEPLDVAHVNSIQTALQEVLATYAKNGAISTGTFELYFGQTNQIVGDVDVELDLEIPSELRRVKVTVSRRYPQTSSNQ